MQSRAKPIAHKEDIVVEPSVLEEMIRAGVPDIEVFELEDLTGTKDHYRATVVTPFFRDKNRVDQHRAIYASLGDLMTGPLHALALSTYTPESWATREG